MEEETEKRRITTIEDLSNDLTVEILLLLPLTSIIQCLNVCKRWQSLINGCPLFLTDTVDVLPIWHQHVCKYTCLEKGQRRIQSSELDFFIDFPAHRYLNHLCCNGLLFSYFFPTTVSLAHLCYISNPLTKERVPLPNPSMRCRDSLCGLAFENNPRIVNSSCNNIAFYKIVIAHSIKKDIKEASYQFEIYSSDKRAWQLLKWASKPRDLGFCKPDQKAVYCNGVLYWHCPCTRQALMFNLETETSGYLDLPSSDDYAFFCKLTECDGQLHYIQRYSHGRRLSVFKMLMNGEWLILHDVDIRGAEERYLETHNNSSDHQIYEPIALSCQGDDKVLLNDNFKRIISYDLKRDLFEIVIDKDFIRTREIFRYTPTNKRIIAEELQLEFNTEKSELQHEFKTEKPKQFKRLSNYARNLLRCFIALSIWLI